MLMKCQIDLWVCDSTSYTKLYEIGMSTLEYLPKMSYNSLSQRLVDT